MGNGNGMQTLIIGAIHVYRGVVSPHLPGMCRFTPSCSVYAEEAILQHGVLRGTLLAGRRLLKCRPFGASGPDPVPPPLRERCCPTPRASRKNPQQ